MVDRPGISYGLFHAKVQPVKTFGIVTTAVKFPGVEMDIGHLRHLRWAKSNQQNDWVAYNRIRGQYASALEHATPERFFVDTTTCNLPTATPTSTPAFDPAKPACAEGISAVKALAVAQSQGQKVFTVTSQSIAAVLPQLTGHSAQTKADVQNAVNAGKEVTISQARITYSGWTGAGYVIIDPQTGAGSYLIEGGANGGSLNSKEGAETWWASWLDKLKEGADWAAKLAEEYGNKLGKLLGKVWGKVGDAIDLVKVLYNCSGMDAYLGFTFLIWFIALGALAAAFSFWIFAILTLLQVLATAYIVDQIILPKCRQ